MGLIVILASIGIPAIRSMMADSRQTAANDMVRARMADARSMAMEQGKAFRFAFVAGTGKFQVAADGDDSWNTVQDTGPIETDDMVRGELPEEIVFGSDKTPFGSGGSGPAQGATWETGVIFQPDGSARDDVTFYFGKADASPMGIRVRGLTGAVRLFDPSTEDVRP
jgi:Tfp pilus assembly protein FimT